MSKEKFPPRVWMANTGPEPGIFYAQTHVSGTFQHEYLSMSEHQALTQELMEAIQGAIDELWNCQGIRGQIRLEDQIKIDRQHFYAREAQNVLSNALAKFRKAGG